jgi:4-diphosphocytidyl-2-C-methyl-D-erythritol kinase
VLRLRAYAKINLPLEVLGRRPDGFHEIVSVTQTISLHDTIEASRADHLSVTMDPPLVSPEVNLVTRAASLLASATNLQPRASILVNKRIPVAAGLGGGSSDAAAALGLLDRLWQTELGLTRLRALAAELGSDVPLFLSGGMALISGRGEIVEPLPAPPTVWLALACPTFDVPDKTRALYGALEPTDWTDGAATRRLAEQIRAGQPILGAPLVNTFDAAAERVYPTFADLRASLADAAGVPVHLTGAGPSLFALFASGAETREAARRMARLGLPTFAAHSIADRPRMVRAAAPPSAS